MAQCNENLNMTRVLTVPGNLFVGNMLHCNWLDKDQQSAKRISQIFCCLGPRKKWHLFQLWMQNPNKQQSQSIPRRWLNCFYLWARSNREDWNSTHQICWKADSVEFPAKMKAGKWHLFGWGHKEKEGKVTEW